MRVCKGKYPPTSEALFTIAPRASVDYGHMS